ncbi:TonB-dependent receptor, partial [bacterium]|nr:TonB-dependent receptor [bacterium]
MAAVLLAVFFAVVNGSGVAFAHIGNNMGLMGDPGTPPDDAEIRRDGAGRLSSVAMDSDKDGKTDLWNYYDAGVFARQERDLNGDGTVDLWLFVGPDGVMTGAKMDADFDGRIDVEERYDGGAMHRQWQDTNADGKFDMVATYAANRLAAVEGDTDHDGRMDRWVHIAPDGESAFVMEDTTGDGYPDRRWTMSEDRPTFAQDGSGMAVDPTEGAAAPPSEDDGADEAWSDEGFVLNEVEVEARRDVSASSSQVIRGQDFKNLPMQNPSDIMRVIPGMHVSQHSGGAKAYQYFLRGFDAEHGQDVAVYLDGVPLNEPSHVHGHGYLDLHFLIPETLDAVRVIKGPYDPEFGNFATAGAVDLIPRRYADHNTLGTTAGMFGTAKVLTTFGVSSDPYLFTGAAEMDHTEGFTDPGWADAYRANQSQTILAGPWSFNLMSTHYDQKSAVADVIPKEYVGDGHIGRYDSIDDSDRVNSDRQLVALTADYDRGDQSLRLQGYFDYKRTEIWSNYTYYLFNPALGDQLEQRDNRHAFGFDGKYRHLLRLGSTKWETTVGAQWQLTDVDQVLANTSGRDRFNLIDDFQFTENSLGLWLREDATLLPWLRLVPGVRFDVISYDGEATQDERYFNIYTNQADTHQDVPIDWNETASVVSPKASVIFTPLRPW